MVKPPRFLTLCIYALFAVCPLLFFTDLTRNPYYTQIALMNILICVSWLLWIWQAWKDREWVWVSSPLDRLLWLFLGICLASWISSFIQHPNFRKPIYSEGSRAYIFLIVNMYLTYAAAVRYQDRDRLKRLLWVSYAVSVAASVYGIAQYYGTEWFWPHNLNPYGSRPVSTFGNPNFMSSYLVMILPVAIADYVFKITGLSRVPLFGVIVTLVGALIATLTRSSWAGGVVAVTWVAVGLGTCPEIWNKVRAPALLLAAALLLLVVGWPKSSSAAYSETVLGRLTEVRQVTKGTYGAVTQRLLIWLCSWEMVQDHPVLGKGWGCLELFYPYYQGPQLENKSFISYRTHANNSHDEILENWSQIGTLGLGVVILLWLIFFRMGTSISARLPVPWKGLEWGLLGGVAGMLVDNLLNVSVHFAVPAFIFWWWVGSAFVLEPASLQLKRFTLQPPGRRLAMGIAALTLIGFSARSAMLWAEEVYFFEGFKLSKSGVDMTTAQLRLEKAFAYHPMDVNNAYELANVYARNGQKEKALAMYQKALDANSGYDEIYFNLATLYMQVGNEPEAIRKYKMTLGINPLSREAYNALTGIYLKNIPKYGEAAEALYHRAVRVFPEDKDLWNNLGYLEVQRQRWEEAYQAYRKAVEVYPDFDLARRNLSIVVPNTSGHSGDPYLKIDQSYAEIERLMKGKQWKEASAKLQELVDLLPRSSRAHFYSGVVLFNLNQMQDAASHYESATRLQPDFIAGWTNLAITYDQLHRTEDGQNAWQRVLQLDKNNAQAKARLHL